MRINGRTVLALAPHRGGAAPGGEPYACTPASQGRPQRGSHRGIPVDRHHLRSATSKATTTVGTAPSPPRRRAKDAEVRSNGPVPSTLDETPKPVVVALLGAGRGRHGNDHRPFPTPLNSSKTMGAPADDDNSRGKVQNVLGDRSAVGPSMSAAATNVVDLPGQSLNSTLSHLNDKSRRESLFA